QDYDFAFKPNWDGRGAKPVTNEIVANASSLFSSMMPLPNPSEVSPLHEGALSFVWDLPEGYLFVSIGPADILHAYYDVPGMGKWEQITSIHNATAINYLRSAVQHLASRPTGKYARLEPLAELLAA